MNIKFENFEHTAANYKQHKKILEEIFWKIKAINENIKIILKGIKNFDFDIIVDFNNQYDEFYIEINNKVVAYIEVLNRIEAINFDKSFLSKEDIKEYKLGKFNSFYKKLGQSNYYFREL